MNYLFFDERQVVLRLQELSPPLRVAFACACAERLMPAYKRFWERTGRGSAKELRELLTAVWNHVEHRIALGSEALDVALQACMALIPRPDDEPWVDEQPLAEDSAAAVAYAIRCLQTGDVQEAAWAARRVYEGLDNFVIARENIDVNAPGAEALVLQHGIVQKELNSQEQDLRMMAGASAQDSSPIIRAMRERAASTPHSLF